MRPAVRLVVFVVYSLPLPAFAGFASTETFLPAVGRIAGQGGAQFYTTVWATNLTGASVNFTFDFLKQGQANTTPASFADTLAPGQTKVYENVVQTKLGLASAIGAARVTSSGEILLAERIYDQAPGGDVGNTEGLFFAGVPKSFSISLGQSASIQGIDQGGAENFRYNFALVETGGGSPTVNVQVFDGGGALLGQKAYPLQPYEQIQPGVADIVAGIATTNARITATVTGGTGSVLLAGAQLANESQDSSGFEMSFRDDLLGGGGTGVTSLNGLTGAVTLTPGSGISIMPSGGSISIAYTGGGGAGGITSVTHDASLAGAGTGASPLAIANGQVVRSVNGLHDAVTFAAGPNVTLTPTGSTVTIAASGGGLTLPFSGEASTAVGTSAFSITDSGNGTAIEGHGNFNDGVRGTSPSGNGVSGQRGDASGLATNAGVVGDSKDSTGVEGSSLTEVGVRGGSISGLGVYGVCGSGAGISGSSKSSDGVIGISQTGNGVKGDAAGANPAAGVFGTTNNTGYGVFAQATGSSGAALGSDATAGGKAAHFYRGDVYIDNNLHVTKQIFAGTKDFEIDHPLDPENEYLVHSSIESSEMLNLYSGNVWLDARGQAAVRVPAWMEAENGDFRYQLTAIGGPARDLFVAREIQDGEFRIAGGISGMKVSWQVTGVRKDAWALANPLVVEREKPEDERGFYLHPELYGAPLDKQVNRDRKPGQSKLAQPPASP